MKQKLGVDKGFLIAVITLVIIGFFIFTSASLGLLAREGARFSNVAFSQTFYGLFLGTIACIITSRIYYRHWRTYAFYLFLASIVLTLLVFVPGLGFAHGGAKRWIALGSFFLQPSEFLKIGFVIYVASWISGIKQKVSTALYGILPLILLCGIVGAILLSQPDTDTFAILCFVIFIMFLVGGGPWRHLMILSLIAVIFFVLVIAQKPYLKERFYTFFDPSRDSLGASYQIQQSLIAIGSGGYFGRGFGQSVQKFNFLPEPIGDSIFAVMAEEFGFTGGLFLILLYIFFAFRGCRIAMNSPDTFGGLLTLGIVILIITQSFVNIAAMLGVLPLSGIPLLFVSHGGSALFITLAEVGIVLNVSRYQKLEKD